MNGLSNGYRMGAMKSRARVGRGDTEYTESTDRIATALTIFPPSRFPACSRDNCNQGVSS